VPTELVTSSAELAFVLPLPLTVSLEPGVAMPTPTFWAIVWVAAHPRSKRRKNLVFIVDQILRDGARSSKVRLSAITPSQAGLNCGAHGEGPLKTQIAEQAQTRTVEASQVAIMAISRASALRLQGPLAWATFLLGRLSSMVTLRRSSQRREKMALRLFAHA
jgi:hypothetical protein